LAFQDCNLLICKLKHKILWKPFVISLHRSIERPSFYGVEYCQITIEHYLLTANEIDFLVKLLSGDFHSGVWAKHAPDCWFNGAPLGVAN